ncbi:MAG TPA: TSUP family transporter [Streptosporangiaceae bacterium]|nr:TSUP family transporter [Streptosporangiaceae bacterium]
MTGLDLLALLGTGILAGLVSVVASLASLVSYPALLLLGLSPVSANVTNTVALMFTAVGAAAGSRPELAGQGQRVLRLGALTAVGGAAGAALLLATPSAGFEYAAPALIALGSVVIMRRPGRDHPATAPPGSAPPGTVSSGPESSGSGYSEIGVSAGSPDATAGDAGPGGAKPSGADPDGAEPEDAGGAGGWQAKAGAFAVAVYVGYFGAAGGILMLAVLLHMFRDSLARTNALKNVISGLANAIAGIGFAIFGPVRWTAVVPLAVGFLIGGWIGPSVVRRLPARGLRVFIGVCGLAVAARLAYGAYL